MKASTQTLGDVIALLPLTLGRRYDANRFGVNAANEVLSEIEQACDPDLFVGETGLFLQSGVTDYTLPDSVRQIKGLYQVPVGDVVPDKGHPVPHLILNGTIRLSEAPTMSSTADISGTVSASPPSDLTKVYDTVNFAGALLAADALTSRLIKVIHGGTGVIEYKVLKGNTPSAFTADINGNLASMALAADTYTITANFLIMEHNRYLARFPTGSTTMVLDLPQDFNYLFRCGLFFRYHSQADNLSDETKFWGQEYARLLESFLIDTTKVRGTSIRNSARSLPPLFK